MCLVSVSGIAVETPGFSEHDLNGRYAFWINGEVTAGPLLGVASGVGYIEFDGQGNVPFATRTLNVAGQLVVQDDEASGTYFIDPDGSGTMTLLTSAGTTETFDLVLVNRQRAFGTVTSAGFVGFGPLERQRP